MEPEKDERVQILTRYQRIMQEIIYRSNVIGSVGQSIRTGYTATDAELIALNFRKTAELIVYANLVGHEKEYASLHPKYAYDWRIEQIIGRIKVINTDYYPQPIKQTPGKINVTPLPPGEWLSEAELIEMYNQCGDLMHAQSPFKPPVDIEPYKERFRTWVSKINKLLDHHMVQLANDKHSVWCIMNPGGTMVPRIFWFESLGGEMPEWE